MFNVLVVLVVVIKLYECSLSNSMLSTLVYQPLSKTARRVNYNRCYQFCEYDLITLSP